MSNVREYREKLGLRQADLLALLKEADPRMDIGTLSRIENDQVLPRSEEVMAALERHLQAPRSDLFDGLEIFFIDQVKAPVGRITALVAAAVPEGHENAISRKDLVEKLGVSDRTAREWLEIAQRDGLAIANFQDGKGYFQPVTDEECRIQYKQQYSRAMSILAPLKNLRRNMA